ncbi:MAG: DUF2157 domain-containing protein [Firmicutes bacterium]|nr:DUF2157 domain-containing protein [Bacillota bacterium]
MLLNKKRFRFVQKVINSWEKDNVLTVSEGNKLRATIELSKFDWNRLAKYSFWIAGISLAIAVFSITFDKAIMAIIMRIFTMSDTLKSIMLTIVSVGFYYWGFRRKKKVPAKFFSNEFLLFVGAIITGVAIGFFGKAVDTGSGHFSLLILMASIIYLVIGGTFPSNLMWTLGLISFGAWFGAETGYLSGWGAYFLGMNYPLRFVFLGLILIRIGFLIKKTIIANLSKPTYVMGLLYLFIALWLMSIFGNYSGDYWYVASKGNLFYWSLLFGITAIAAIIWGLKTDDSTIRKFGITFLFINLYTKYFEYFWNSIHKALFFAILAVSFWAVGRYSEKVWNKIKEKMFDEEG